METVFFEISIVLIVGTFFATIASFLKQPLIPAYILSGVLLGPPVFHVIESGELLHALSTFGIAFLLFLVGIDLDLRKLMKTGRISILTGVLQMLFSIAVGFLLIQLFGFSKVESLIFAIALGFSSTIVIMKLLSEKKELDSLFGQIAIGLMLTQDFIAIVFLLFFEVATSGAAGSTLIMEVLLTALKGGVLIAVALLTSKYVLSVVFRYFARSTELLYLGSISWCLVFAGIAIMLGFSIEVGALLAGISLSFVPYTIEISNRIRSLRDFFLPIFFAVLGAQLVFDGNTSFIWPTIVFSLLVLVAYPVVVGGLMLIVGYRARTAFYVGVSIAQISEFSFIVVSLGVGAGLVGQDIVALVALVGLITMTLSTYMIEFKEQLYKVFAPIIKPLERKKKARTFDDISGPLKDHVVLAGYHTMGARILQKLQKEGKEVVVIDFNPDVHTSLRSLQVDHIYGSISDPEVLEKANIGGASVIISTIPDREATLSLLEYVRKHRLKVKVFVLSLHVDDALDFYEQGAEYVIYPGLEVADHINSLVASRSLETKKKTHIKELKRMSKLNEA